ncbi:MAG: dihydrofolate reductase family protein [Bacteroidota bacterium]
MKKIVYYVASSIDGFIAGPNGDISKFQLEGPAVDKYHSDLQSFQTVIMGRNTYEFGYQYGLEPGHPAYPHMKHFIFSNTLEFNVKHDQVQCLELSAGNIEKIRNDSPTDVYLCGGGQFAGWLLEQGLIDTLKLKLNPTVLEGGVRIFGDSKASVKMELIQRESFDKAFDILTYNLS